MRFGDLIETVFQNLRRMKLRLALTALGVIIGTSSVVLMVSLGIGLQQNITESLSDFGDATHITVQGGFSDVMGMGTGDVEALNEESVDEFAQIEGVSAVLARLFVPVDSMEYRRYSTNMQVVGVDMDAVEDFGFVLAEGRLAHGEKEIVIGDAVTTLFAGGDPFAGERASDLDLMGKRITLSTTKYPQDMSDPQAQPTTEQRQVTVVGVLDVVDMETDLTVFMPMETALDIADVDRRRAEYSLITVKAESTEIAADIEKTIADRGYMTFSARSMQDAIGQTFAIIQLVLGAIGGIALLVASLGIANTMTMSILERTREIGIMKAIGASGRQIRRIFLGEAAVIGLIGGFGGLILSAAGAALANLFVTGMIASQPGAGAPATESTNIFVIPVWLAVFAVAFSAGVGLLAGVLPAIRAANLDPLVALRHE